MNVDARVRKLTTLAVAAVVGLALAAAPAPAQQAGGEAQEPQQARTIQVKILGMSCPFCAYGAEQKLKKVDGVKELDIELESGIATLTMEEGADVPNEKLKRTVEDAGFEAAAIVRTFESEFEDWNPEELPGREGSGKASAEVASGPRSG